MNIHAQEKSNSIAVSNSTFSGGYGASIYAEGGNNTVSFENMTLGEISDVTLSNLKTYNDSQQKIFGNFVTVLKWKLENSVAMQVNGLRKMVKKRANKIILSHEFLT